MMTPNKAINKHVLWNQYSRITNCADNKWQFISLISKRKYDMKISEVRKFITELLQDDNDKLTKEQIYKFNNLKKIIYSKYIDKTSL